MDVLEVAMRFYTRSWTFTLEKIDCQKSEIDFDVDSTRVAMKEGDILKIHFNFTIGLRDLIKSIVFGKPLVSDSSKEEDLAQTLRKN